MWLTSKAISVCAREAGLGQWKEEDGKGIMEGIEVKCRFEEEFSRRAGLVGDTGEKSEVVDEVPTVGLTDYCSWNRRPIPDDEGPLTEWVGAKGERMARMDVASDITACQNDEATKSQKCVQNDVQVE